MDNVVNNKRKNIVLIVCVMALIIVLFMSIFTFLDEVPARIYFEDRSSIWGKAMKWSLFNFPFIILILYFFLEKKILRMLETTSFKGNLFLIVSWSVLVIIIGYFLWNNLNAIIPGELGYCNEDLEFYNGLFSSCAFSGLEYLFFPLDLFVPVFFILMWKIIKNVIGKLKCLLNI